MAALATVEFSPGVALGPVLDMPVVVQSHMHCSGVKVVDISVVAQMQSPMVLTVQNTIQIPSLQSFGRWSTSLLGRSSRFHVCVCVKSAETPQLHALFSFPDKIVDMPVLFNDNARG